MTKTIIALYDDIVVARQVVEDLVNADFERSAISLITNDANNQYSRYLDKDYVPREDAVTATEGAGFGAIVGVLTGALVGLAALTVPGVGLVIAAGPIVAGLTGALAGAVTGGIVGALVKSGVPEDEAPYYAEGIRRGGTLVSVETSNTLRGEDIMNRYGSINIHERVDVWRQAGWKGFKSEENKDTHKSSQEPLIEDDDRDRLSSAMITDPTIDDLTIPDVSVLDEESANQVTLTEPDLLTLEEELSKEHEYTVDDSRTIEVKPESS